MKTKNLLIPAVALILTACAAGTHVSTGYVDDIYFNPQDMPPPVTVQEPVKKEAKAETGSPERLIISEIKKNDEGSQTMNNYIFDGKNADKYADVQHYNMEQMNLENSDTTVYTDDNEIKYVINNYYDGNDMDFTSRIHMFHRPFFYGPYYYNNWYWNDWYWDPWYYDSWYSPYSSLYWGWGMDPWYNGWYGGFYGGWYGGMYSPYGYWGGGWGYPYYAWGNPYYDYWGYGNINSDNFRYGKRRDYNTMVIGGGGGNSGPRSSAVYNDRSSLKSTESSGVSTSLTGGRSISGAEGGGRPSRGSSVSGADTQNSTIMDLRRGSNPSSVPSSNSVTTRRYSNSQMQYTRPVNPDNGQIQNGVSNSYSPSYNQQRSSTRSNFNVQNYDRQGSNSQSGNVRSVQRPVTVYSRPNSSSSSDRTYRSSSTYNRSSSSGYNPNRSYSAPSENYYKSAPSNSGSYSAPSRSYDSGGGSRGSYSGGGSSGGSSSGGGGGGTSSHSGRR